MKVRPEQRFSGPALRALCATMTFTLAGTVALVAMSTARAHSLSTYESDVTSFTVTDSSGTPMAAIVHYPASRTDGQPMTALDQFPAVVFMQGANVDGPRYDWLRGIAERGYILVLPDKYPLNAVATTGSGTNFNTKMTTVDLLDHTVKRLPVWAGSSPVAGHFDGRVVVAGHSLGAVVAIVAVDETACLSAGGGVAGCPTPYIRDPSIVAMWLIGGHFENPYGPPDSTPINKPAGFPIYLIAGGRDGLSTPLEVKTTMNRYQAPKIYYELPGANHFGWTEYLHPVDDLRIEVPATISKKAQQAATVDAVVRFMDCHLRGDLVACGQIPATPYGL